MGEFTKEIVKTAVLNEKSKTNDVIQELYFNDLSNFFFVKGVKNSRYYFIAKDMANIKRNSTSRNFSLKPVDLHPYTVDLLKNNEKTQDIFDYNTLDPAKISTLREVIESYNHYAEAVMIAKIIEREERIILITTFFAVLVPLATLVLGIITLILTLSNAKQ
jgi:hypothetical protein